MIYENFFFCSSFESINPEMFYQILQESFESFSTLEIDLKAVIEGFVKQTSNSIVSARRYEHNIVRIIKKPMAMPINFITSSMENPSEFEWLSSETFDDIITIPADTWFLLNVDQFGFYRVNYDENNWRAIIQALKDNENAFSIKTRAQLIDDSLALAKDGFLSYEIAFGLLMEMKNEKSFLPWNAAMRNILVLKNLLAKSSVHHEFNVSL
jgi:hypothetical protein